MDRYAQRSLDAAVMKQALTDLQLSTNGITTRRLRREGIDQMLDAARWLFANPDPMHLFSPTQSCQRLGIDVRKLTARVFAKLSTERQQEIRIALRHYRCSLMPAS